MGYTRSGYQRDLVLLTSSSYSPHMSAPNSSVVLAQQATGIVILLRRLLIIVRSSVAAGLFILFNRRIESKQSRLPFGDILLLRFTG